MRLEYTLDEFERLQPTPPVRMSWAVYIRGRLFKGNADPGSSMFYVSTCDHGYGTEDVLEEIEQVRKMLTQIRYNESMGVLDPKS